MDCKIRIYVWITFLIGASCLAQGTVVWEDRVRFLREPNERILVNAGWTVEIPCLAVDGSSNSSGRRLSARWLRDGQLINDLTPRPNGSLVLRNVQMEQEAIYQCVVLSPRYGVLFSQRANLTVSKITRFTEEPQDVIASMGGVVRFQCIVAADSIPSATIAWFHNDLPLGNDDQRFRTLASGILQIVDVERSDEGSYYCVASNVAGNITSRKATLTTSNDSFTPSFEHHSPVRVFKAPSNVSVSGDQTAVFECLFENADNVIWKRIDDSPISSRAYRVGTNLVVEHVSTWDEGIYACIGSHSGENSVTLLAHLSVDSAPEIRKLPEEKLSRRGEWWRFHCDTASKPAPEIVWYKNGERLRSRGRVKIFPSEDSPPNRLEKPSGEIHYGRDLLISSVQADDVGIYQCFASNYLGTASAAAALSYLDVDLDGPSNLTAAVLPNQRDVQLAWQAPSSLSDRYQISVYIVHFHESDAGSENTIAVQQDACHDGICRTVCCSNVDLVPFTNYTFWVDALVVHQGEPLFTRTTDLAVITSGDAVALTVASAMVQELPDASRVRLSWKKPSDHDLRGQVLEYRIEIRESSLEDAVDEYRNPITVSSASSDFVVDGLEPNRVAYLRVIPRTRAGYPEQLPEKIYPWLRYKTRTFNASDDVPAAPVVESQALNSSSVLVHWYSTSGINSSKWMISAYNPRDGSTVARSDVHGHLNSVILLGLASDTLYQLSVMAIDSDGTEGLASGRLVRTVVASSVVPIQIPPAVEPIIPFPTPKCELIGSGKLKVFWNTPPMKIKKFAIRYSLLPDDNEPLNVSAYVKQVDTTSNSLIFTDLTPGRSYLFAARAQNSDGYKSGFSDDINCFVPMTKPPPPTKVEVTVINGTSLLVTWIPPAISSGWSEIQLFHVRYWTALGGATNWKEISVNGSVNSVFVAGLNASTVYFVTVTSENEAGLGAASEAEMIPLGISGVDSSSKPSATVIFQTSYKEGIIVGVCIAIICAAICATVIIVRSRRDRQFHIPFFSTRRRSTPAKSPNGHVPNGHCGNQPLIELAEIQTLLPRLVENAESDSKGGTGFACPRGQPVYRANFSLPPPSTNPAVNGTGNAILESSQPHNELLMVSVQTPNVESDQQREQSSDLSHSPATGSSLGSWVHSNNGDQINSLLQKHQLGSISMPNLFDSGIGFDDLSTSLPYNGRYQPFSITGGSPRRGYAPLENGTTPLDSVTLPGGTTTDGSYPYSNIGKKRFRDLFVLRQPRDQNVGRASTALGQGGSALTNSRATSECTC